MYASAKLHRTIEIKDSCDSKECSRTDAVARTGIAQTMIAPSDSPHEVAEF